eukprot:3940311-Rhodomonas_salina.2
MLHPQLKADGAVVSRFTQRRIIPVESGRPGGVPLCSASLLDFLVPAALTQYPISQGLDQYRPRT